MIRTKSTEASINLSPAVLTNDPSLTAWGWAVVRGKQVIDSGCIKTKPEQKKRRIRKSDDTARRVSEINMILLQAIRKYNIKFLLSESPHGSQNASAAVMIGICYGVMQTLSDTLNIPIEYYSEGDSKKAALGKISATKQEMVAKMIQKYSAHWYTGVNYKDEAVADALAVHHVASIQSSTLKILNSK